jgi:hypothetical protein
MGLRNRFSKLSSGLSDRRSRRPRGRAPGPVTGVAGALWKGVLEVYAIAREMLSIAATVLLGFAERIGKLELVVIRRALLPAWRALVSFGAAAVRIGAREVTPARATAAVTVFAIVVLGVSQFTEYRQVQTDVAAYQGVDDVVGAPEVPGSARDTGSAHAYLGLLLAIAALALLVLALRGRWRLARLLGPIGLLVILLSALVDAPQGLDEGPAASQAFANEEARLLAGFWAQLSAGVVLLVTGPLLAFDLDPSRARRARPAPTGPTLFQRLGRRLRGIGGRAGAWGDSRSRSEARGSGSSAQEAGT